MLTIKISPPFRQPERVWIVRPALQISTTDSSRPDQTSSRGEIS